MRRYFFIACSRYSGQVRLEEFKVIKETAKQIKVDKNSLYRHQVNMSDLNMVAKTGGNYVVCFELNDFAEAYRRLYETIMLDIKDYRNKMQESQTLITKLEGLTEFDKIRRN